MENMVRIHSGKREYLEKSTENSDFVDVGPQPLLTITITPPV